MCLTCLDYQSLLRKIDRGGKIYERDKAAAAART